MSERAGNEAGAAEAAKPAGGEGAAAAAAAAPAAKGGMAAWMPLIVTLVAMPGLAFAATKFLIVPQLQKTLAQAAPAAGAAAGGGHDSHGAAAGNGPAPAASAHGEKPAGGHDAAPAAGGHGATAESPSFTLNKLIVNVAGTMGTRYLLVSMSVQGANPVIKAKAEERRDQLIDLAGTALSHKTISELEKPGARTQIRSELMTVFNEVLGEGGVKDIYFTEFNIQ